MTQKKSLLLLLTLLVVSCANTDVYQKMVTDQFKEERLISLLFLLGLFALWLVEGMKSKSGTTFSKYMGAILGTSIGFAFMGAVAYSKFGEWGYRFVYWLRDIHVVIPMVLLFFGGLPRSGMGSSFSAFVIGGFVFTDPSYLEFAYVPILVGSYVGVVIRMFR